MGEVEGASQTQILGQKRLLEEVIPEGCVGCPEERGCRNSMCGRGCTAGSPSLPRWGWGWVEAGDLEGQHRQQDPVTVSRSLAPLGAYMRTMEGLESQFSDSKVLGFNFLPSPSFKILLQGAQCPGGLEAIRAPCSTAAPRGRQFFSRIQVAVPVTKEPIAPWWWPGCRCEGKSNFCRTPGNADWAGLQRSPLLSQTSHLCHWCHRPVGPPELTLQTPLSLISIHLWLPEADPPSPSPPSLTQPPK